MRAFYYLVINFILVTSHIVTEECDENLYVNDIATSLVALLGADENNTRIKHLKEKLTKIDKYVVNKNKYTDFLLNETMSTDLNETNFFNALNESDHFSLVSEKDPKNLYLKLKEKMTRDDIVNILAKQNERGNLFKSARKMMKNLEEDNEVIDNIVDKMIAQSPKDNHKYKHNIEDDKYWGTNTR